MKKKIFALLLAVLMLVPFIVACGDTSSDTITQSDSNTQTTDTSTGSGNETTDTSIPTDTSTGGTTTVEKVDTKTDKSQKWSGQTLDCIAGGWGSDAYGQAGAWSQPELYVKGFYQDGSLGQTVNNGVWARQTQVEKIYGVTMVWHQAKSNTTMQNELQTGLEAGAAKYHIATPRAYETQALIAAETVYDLANSKYIDLTKSYYNQAAVDSFSIYGHTFFVAGVFF